MLWTVAGGPHGPNLTNGFRDGAVDFVLGHPKAGVRFTDPQTLTWPAVRWAQSYRVYRGLLADLFDNDADGVADLGYGDCVSTTDVDPTDTTLTVADAPSPGTGYFYVVGFVDDVGTESILGTTGGGAPRMPTIACP